MKIAAIAKQCSRFFVNRSLITQLVFVFCLLVSSWFVGAYTFTNKLFTSQLLSQAETVVNNAEAVGDHVSQHSRFWIKAGGDYSGKWIEQVAAPDGTFFYSKNPAMVQRELSDQIYANGFPARFRLTALNVMNPSNAPNEFERASLEEISHSISQKPKYQYADNQFQYVKPIYYVSSCLACHGDVKAAPASVRALYGETNGYGFKVGDLAGAISVNLDVDKSQLITDVLDYRVVVFIIVPTLLFFIFFIKLTRDISRISNKISTYNRGEPIGINSGAIDRDSSNEIHGLIISVASIMELLQGTHNQLTQLTKRMQGKSAKEAEDGKR